MIFEKIGRFCISFSSPLGLYLLLLMPVLGGFALFSLQYIDLHEQIEAFAYTTKKGISVIEKKKRKDLQKERYTQPNPYFLEEQVESLSFLEEEQKELEMLKNHPALFDRKAIETRLSYCKNGNNQLSFTEQDLRSQGSIKESEEKLRHPVEMSSTDIKKLLSLLEDTQIETFSPPPKLPQIVITDFVLENKETPLNKHVFEVDMQLMKREFLR